MMGNVLIVEDDIALAQIIESFLSRNGFTSTYTSTLKGAQNFIQKQSYDLFLLDYRLPDGTGLDLLQSIRMKNQTVPVVIMTGFNDVRTVVRAMKMGAADYIIKPVNPDELLMILKQALEQASQEKVSSSDKGKGEKYVKGESEEARKLHEVIDLVAPTNMAVIIEGESGTGKEYVARSIHAASKRASKPFVPIDCGVLSKDLAATELFGYTKGAFTGALMDKKGQFESASGGTLFLDEIGNLSYEVQIKLLRAIQERVVQPVGSDQLIKVDIRFIVATSADLLSHVEKGEFREDLYHRLNEFKILVPSLKERKADMPLFIECFMREANTDLSRSVESLSPRVNEIFSNYEWPGNLRELRNTIRRMVLLCKSSVAGEDLLPPEMFMINSKKENSIDLGTNLKDIQANTEKQQILRVLEEVRGNKSKAARQLNIDRKTLYNKMEKYGLT
ncbi:MAG: sigma-54-dependent transcriptional regulator [Bacteroidales bacterium]